MSENLSWDSVLDAELLELTDAMLVLDPDWRVVRVNAEQERISRRPRAETLGRTFGELWPDVWHEGSTYYTQYQRCMRERVAVEFEEYYAPRDLWTLVTARPLRASGIAISFRDVTARRRAEEATRASEERLRLLVEHAPAAIALFDRDLRYLAHSRRYLNDRKLPGESLVGCLHGDVFPWAPAHWREALQRALAGESVRSDCEPVERADGSREWVRWEAVPWRRGDGGVGGAVLFSEDLTPLKAAEDELVAQRQLLQSIVDGAPTFISAFDRELRYTLVNEPAARAVGLAKESLLGQPGGFFLPADRAASLRARFAEVLATGESQVEEVTQEIRGDLRTVLAMRYPLRGPDGLVHGVAAALTDITAQKRVEADLRASEARAKEALAALESALEVTRRTEEKLRQAQKMEAVGQLAGGVAHDFNNLLTVILGSVYVVLETLRPGDPAHDDLREIEKAGNRAAALTQQLLAFSRKQVLAPRLVDLNEMVRNAERLLARVIGEDVELRLALSPRLDACLIDPGQFEQVLVNLAVNARDAMPDGGGLLIETANVVLDEAYAREHPDVAPGAYVRVSVSDTGVGMSREVRAHLFEPFFTTKEVGRGTGLGLATVYGVVKQSGGAIWVYSEPMQGTTFKLYFPSATGRTPEAHASPDAPESRRGHETVLLVEDDGQVRGTVAAMLRRGGYHVISAANGGEALLICEQHAGTIHLLLTDVVMPKLNGRKVAERLTALRPGLRVLFMSGYTENAIVHHGVLDPGLDFIAKPITPRVLLAKVRELLDREGPPATRPHG
ncbi:MAG: PAS domain-containing protein [Polyangiales bacterium]